MFFKRLKKVKDCRNKIMKAKNDCILKMTE